VFLVVSGVSAAGGLLLLGLVLGLHSYPLLVLGFIFTGYGTATGAFGATVAATQGVNDDEQGLAGGLINTSRQVGAALGVAVAAAVIGTGATSGGSVDSDRGAVLVAAAAAVMAAVLAFRGIGRGARRDSPPPPAVRASATAGFSSNLDFKGWVSPPVGTSTAVAGQEPGGQSPSRPPQPTPTAARRAQ
jgi:MFS family permease